MRSASIALLVLVSAFGSLAATPSSEPAIGGDAAASRVGYGESVAGRELRAIRLGDAEAKRSVLIVGSIHGDERQGERIVRRLRKGPDRFRADLWTIQASNPDGARAARRTNARGVDLNRNFPHRWRRTESPGSGYYQGPRPASEPETRALMRLIRRVDPSLTIWYHQPWDQVLAPCGGSAEKERRYARIARMAVERCRGEDLRGTATSWEEHRDRRATAFVVELHAGSLDPAELSRHARAARALAGWGSRGAD